MWCCLGLSFLRVCQLLFKGEEFLYFNVNLGLFHFLRLQLSDQVTLKTKKNASSYYMSFKPEKKERMLAVITCHFLNKEETRAGQWGHNSSHVSCQLTNVILVDVNVNVKLIFDMFAILCVVIILHFHHRFECFKCCFLHKSSLPMWMREWWSSRCKVRPQRLCNCRLQLGILLRGGAVIMVAFDLPANGQWIAVLHSHSTDIPVDVALSTTYEGTVSSFIMHSAKFWHSMLLPPLHLLVQKFWTRASSNSVQKSADWAIWVPCGNESHMGMLAVLLVPSPCKLVHEWEAIQDNAHK